jgi:hypothetical protein
MPRKATEPDKQLLERLAELDLWRQQAKEADDAAKKLSPTCIDGMLQLGIKSVIFSANGRDRRATLVEPTKTTVDDTGLLAALTPAQRKLVSRTVVDKEALAEAIDAGMIDVKKIAPFVHNESGTKSIRISGSGQ